MSSIMEKNLVIIFTLLLFTICISAQTTNEGRKREIGLRFSNINFDGINDFNLVYKKQKRNNDNKYRRYRMLIANFTSSDFFDDFANSNIQIGAAIGLEKRKQLNDRFKFIHGLELFFDYQGKRIEDAPEIVTSNNIGLSIGYVVGFQYDLNNNFCLNLETIPAIRTNSTIESISPENEYSLGFTFGLGMVSKAAISIFYKF